MYKLAFLCAGIVLCALLPALPPWFLLPALWLMLWPLWWRSRRTWLCALLWFSLGLSYACWRAELRLAQRLDPALADSVLHVQGVVRGLADPGEFGMRFRFEVQQAGVALPPVLLLNDYRQRPWPAGSRWELSVRLRQPHGAANVAGFDAERWYWSEGILATGTVGKARYPRPAAGRDAQAWLDALRERIAVRLAGQGEQRDGALLAALAVGAQQGIARAQWDVLSATGLTHIVSVSGLHITLVASLVAGAASLLRRRWPRLPAMLPWWAGAAAALLYALLAGFSVPTQRTVWMLLTVCVALALHRGLSALQVWLAALTVVLLLDPFAVLAAGFWLSFGLVGALIAGEVGLRQRPAAWRSALWAQWRATLASFVPLLWLFGSFPWLSPLANALAIPLVSFVLTPLVLLAAALPFDSLAWLAGKVAHAFWWEADWLAQWPPYRRPLLPWQLWLAGVLGSLVWLLPLGRAWRSWGVLLLLPLLLYRAPRPPAGELWAEVIDVGQGLAVLLHTARHDVLFDTGAGEAGRVLLPVLRARGVVQLDALLLSHHDTDHDGAADTLLQQLTVHRLFRGQPGSAAGWRGQPCQAGQSWVWDGIRFDVLWPTPVSQGEDNALSCVLRVATPTQALMLTGDATLAVENTLVRQYGTALRSQVLVLGHHGSRTSSGADWLAVLQPQHAIVSAGYQNRYRHPHAEVLSRLHMSGITVWRTDTQGAVQLKLGSQLQLASVRQGWQPYWAAR